MKILFINYVDAEKVISGSGVRPKKMLEAFYELGLEVVQLTGEQTSPSRVANIRRIIEYLNHNNDIDLCYIESPTYPILRHLDRKLLHIIKQKRIPMAYFYRDFYRKFPNYFPRRKDVIGALKETVLDLLQYLTDKAIKNCDIIYVPSNECSVYIKHSNIKPLPPAGNNYFLKNRKKNHTIIYVGGIIGQYNGKLIVNAINELHKRDKTYKLILVCRKEEWEKFDSPYKNESWISVYHSSGTELRKLYYEAAAAAAAGQISNAYYDMAISVKTFEYLSYGLPQVVVGGKAIKRIIEKEKIGIIVEPSPIDMADKLELLLNDDGVYESFQKSIFDSLTNRNLWVHRAQIVIDDLNKCGKEQE